MQEMYSKETAALRHEVTALKEAGHTADIRIKVLSSVASM